MAQTNPFHLSAVESKDGGVLFREALREAQAQVSINGTSEMTLDEINDIISEVRNENQKQK